jgi:hypothetical protein
MKNGGFIKHELVKVIKMLDETGLPFQFGGSLSLYMLGLIDREPEDIDVFISRKDAQEHRDKLQLMIMGFSDTDQTRNYNFDKLNSDIKTVQNSDLECRNDFNQVYNILTLKFNKFTKFDIFILENESIDVMSTGGIETGIVIGSSMRTIILRNPKYTLFAKISLLGNYTSSSKKHIKDITSSLHKLGVVFSEQFKE